jgi:hypothetical protein
MRSIPCITALFVSAAFLGGCATNAAISPRDVPYAVRAPATEHAILQVFAEGVQEYECVEGWDRRGWKFKGPVAVLKTANGAELGKHYAGPTWEFTDGSKVVGQVIASAPARDRKSIPRLLLGAKAHEGSGVFSEVTEIQRLATRGGGAPGSTCEFSELGRVARVPYTATYVFLTSDGRYADSAERGAAALIH